jgi:hypothetical protein
VEDQEVVNKVMAQLILQVRLQGSPHLDVTFILYKLHLYTYAKDFIIYAAANQIGMVKNLLQ